MAVTKQLARGWTITVGAVPIGGINSMSLSRGKSDADTTDFDSDGWEEHLVASRNASVTFEGFYLEDASDGSRDAGQEAIEDLSVEFGASALGAFVLTSPGGTTYTFSASVEMADVGGGNNDPTSWGFTATVSGEITIV